MSQRLTVIQHHPAESVGEIGVWADRHDIALDIHRADLDDLPHAALPHDVMHRCVILGGPYAVNDPPAWLMREKQWLRSQLDKGMHVLGICLGSQLLAEALGGSVHALHRPEMGWTRIDFSDGSQRDVLQWHEDGFTPPPGSDLLASSAAASQMFQSGAHMGIQFHPEWNAALVDALNACFGDGSPLPRVPDAQRHALIAHWFHQVMDAWWIAAAPVARQSESSNP